MKNKGITLSTFIPEVDETWALDRLLIEPIKGAESFEDVELQKVKSNAMAHIQVTIKAPKVDNEFLAEFFQSLANSYATNSTYCRMTLTRKNNLPQ